MASIFTPLQMLSRLAIVAGCAIVCGCAATNPRDPLETYNRAMFGFNEGVDQVIIRPAAKGYSTVMPQVARTGVSNVFSNVGDVWISINNLLQGKPVEAAGDLGRFLINTTLGVGGLIDWASDWGLEKHDEDFGQTLGRWGVGSGPYVVLPFVGPRTVRDGLGFGVDSVADPLYEVDPVRTRNSLIGLRLVEDRAQLLPLDKTLEEAVIDKYAYVRDAYLQRRRNLIYDGRPPREPDNEASQAPASVAGIPLDPQAAVSQLVMMRVEDEAGHEQCVAHIDPTQ